MRRGKGWLPAIPKAPGPGIPTRPWGDVAPVGTRPLLQPPRPANGAGAGAAGDCFAGGLSIADPGAVAGTPTRRKQTDCGSLRESLSGNQVPPDSLAAGLVLEWIVGA